MSSDESSNERLPLSPRAIEFETRLLTYVSCSQLNLRLSSQYSNATSLNENEFIICPAVNNPWNTLKIAKYNSKTDKWTDIYTHKERVRSVDNSIAFNSGKNLIYIYNSESKLTIIDLNSKGFMNCPINTKYDSSHGSSFVINDEYHMIGGNNHSKHLIWKQQIYKFKKKHTFSKFKKYYVNHRIIHLTSKKIVFLFGGSDMKNVAVNDIFCYEYENNKWIKLSLKLPAKMASFGCVLTTDERFILFFGGYKSRKIYILNVERMVFRESNIECVSEGPCHAVLLGNNESDILVFGYIRLNYEEFKLKNPLLLDPSIDIMKLIALFYSDQFVHLLHGHNSIGYNEKYFEFHYKIPLNQIFTEHPYKPNKTNNTSVTVTVSNETFM